MADALEARGTISLLLADVDGTLVTEDKVLTERARRRSIACTRRASASRSPAGGRPAAWPC